MTTASKNSLLLSAIVAGFVSLPMTWLHASNVSFGPPAMEEIFGNIVPKVNLDITGLNGTIRFLGGLPFWGAILIVVAASAAQLLNNTAAFNFPRPAVWIIAIVGAVGILFPLAHSIMSSANVSPRLGGLVAMFAALVPIVALATPDETNMATAQSTSAIQSVES